MALVNLLRNLDLFLNPDFTLRVEYRYDLNQPKYKSRSSSNTECYPNFKLSIFRLEFRIDLIRIIRVGVYSI